jgi:hypothetical protein
MLKYRCYGEQLLLITLELFIRSVRVNENIKGDMKSEYKDLDLNLSFKVTGTCIHYFNVLCM